MRQDELKLEIETLRKEVDELREMVSKLQVNGKAAVPAPPAAAPASPKIKVKGDGVSEETLTIIAAAVAAFLGKRATIKLVRPTQRAVDGWRLQGRVAIQASHRTR